MHKEPKPMREIHEIRERFYEETKNLSYRDHILKIHKEAEKVMKESGLRVIELVSEVA
jgi:hypothetical protein